MALIASLVSAAATGASVDFTDSTAFAGATPKLAIFLGGGTGSADAITDGASFQLGASDGTTHGSMAFSCDTKSAASNVGRSNQSDAAYTCVDTAGAQTAEATCALAANKATLSFSNQSAGETVYALLLGGDIEVAVVNFSSPGGTGDKEVTHGLTAAPEFIFIFGTGTVDNTNDSNSVQPTIGFWITGDTQVGCGHRIGDNLTTSALVARISSTQAVISMGGSGIAYAANIHTVNATTFQLNFDTSTINRFHIVSVRSTSGTALGLAAGSITAKTSTGTQTDATGMSQNAQVVLSISTALTALDSTVTTDPAGCYGFGIACKNSGTGTWQYGSVVSGADDGVTISASSDWMNHQHSASKHINQLDTTGTTAVAATVDSATGGNLVHNYGTASGTAVRIPFLAIGADVPASGNAARSRFYEMMRANA